mmetsp:Transcript_14374/g.21321  ORF Transcript_14374/g.21321 Transcript_14374/m.21321 type:complete len:80 (-) Transcript_14374:34-273(-)
MSHGLGGLFENPAGSKPTSPTRDPSRFSGRLSKGMAVDLSETIERAPVFAPVLGATNAAAGMAINPIKENTFIVRFCFR